MTRVEARIDTLSSRLQADLLAFRGMVPGAPPRFRSQLLIPVGVLVGVALVLLVSPKARKSLLLEVTLAGIQAAWLNEGARTPPFR